MIRMYNITTLNIKERISLTVSLMAVAAMMIAPTSINDVYAENNSDFVWQLLFVKASTCNPNDVQDNQYADITSTYFENYQLENTIYEVNCITELEYQKFEMAEEVDLLILVYEQELGEKILQPNNLDGIYVHTGNDRAKNHLIIMCDCSDFDSSYESILPSWILSHELSHFVLSYKGFPQSAIQERIHEIENEYDNCVGTNFQDNSCNNFKLTIRPETSSKDVVVMAPFEPAVGNKLIKFIPDDYSDHEVIDLQRELAKMWITNNIDDQSYSNTLKHLVDNPLQNEIDDHTPFLEIPNGFIIAELSKNKDVQWDEYLNQETDNEKNISLLLDYIPFNLEEQSEEFNLEKMPNWFKTRALLWSEKRISDKVFFDGVEHLVRLGTINLD